MVMRTRIGQRSHRRAHECLAQVGDDQALRAEDAGREGNEATADAEAARHVGRMQRSGAAEGEQGEGARVVAALDRDRADGTHHVGDDDAEDAVRGALEREAEAFGERRDRRARQALVERHVAAEQPARRQPAEHEVRIGHRRFACRRGRSRRGPAARRRSAGRP